MAYRTHTGTSFGRAQTPALREVLAADVVKLIYRLKFTTKQRRDALTERMLAGRSQCRWKFQATGPMRFY